MSITEERKPYEFLVRWDREAGLIAGAHIIFSDAILRDGVLVSETLVPAQPVGENGFPLNQVLDQITIDALSTVSALHSEAESLKAEISILKRKLDGQPEEQSGALPPSEVTMRQARLALLQAGVLAAVQPAIDALPEPDRTAANIEWEYSQTVVKDKPFVQMLGAALGLSTEQIDDLFTLAATL